MPGPDLSRRLARCVLAVVVTAALVSALLVSSVGATVVPTGISPQSGSPGTTITVTGSGFSTATMLSGLVGSEQVPVTVQSDSQLTLQVPADAPPGATTVSLKNSAGVISPGFSFTVLVLAALASPLEAGAGYSTHLVVSGGRAPYTFSFASGTLPGGLGLSAAGTISGTPVAAGSTSFVLAAVDANHVSANFPVTIVIGPGPSVLTSALPVAYAGTAYAVSLQATGGTSPYTWSLQSGALPGGVVLSSTGVLSGIPGTTGSSTVSLRVTDALGSSGVRSLGFTARVPPEGLVLASSSGATESVSTLTPATVGAPVIGVVPVGVASSADGTRMWVATSTGAVLPLGSTPSLGALGRPPRRPVVAIAATPSGSGYFLVTSAGRVYGFGLRQRGSVAGPALKGKVVAMSVTSSGDGYVIATTKGMIASFGNAPAGATIRLSRLRGRIVGVAMTADNRGYLVATSTGHVYAFGSARKVKLAPLRPTGPVVGIVAAPTGVGYWLVTATGAVLASGSASPLTPLLVPPGPVVAAALAD